MSDLKEKLAHIDDLAPLPDEDVTPDHRQWMSDQIEQALERHRSGRASFKTLEETRRKFETTTAFSLYDAPQAVHDELLFRHRRNSRRQARRLT